MNSKPMPTRHRLRPQLAAACGALLLITGCTNSANEPSPETRTAGATPASPSPLSNPESRSPTPSPTPSSVRPPGKPRAREVASDLEAPWGLVPLKDGSFLISERDTRKIIRVRGGSTSEIRTIDEADPAGEGDIRVWPSIDERGSAAVVMELHSPDGRLVAQLETHALYRFLTRTLALVPAGIEPIDLDLLVESLVRQSEPQ